MALVVLAALTVQVLILTATTTSPQPCAESVSKNLCNHPVTCTVYHMFISTLQKLRIIDEITCQPTQLELGVACGPRAVWPEPTPRSLPWLTPLTRTLLLRGPSP